MTSEVYRKHPEQERGPVENPQIIALLGSAGLNAVDLQLFDRLRQQDQSIFVHGSIMAGRITERSDIDFTVIGDRNAIAPELRDTIMLGLAAAEQQRAIDYVSTVVYGQDGRKISMHMSEPSFREAHPAINKPYATEYRPGIHAKVGPRKYFLSGADRDGNIRLINFVSESEVIGSDKSTVTDIPQTGLLTLKDGLVYVDGKKKSNMTFDEIIRLRADGSMDTMSSADSEEVMILGLEFDKMQSDKSIYNDPDAEQRFVKDPSTRSMDAIGEFTKTDPSVITNRLFSELAGHWSKVKPNKPR